MRIYKISKYVIKRFLGKNTSTNNVGLRLMPTVKYLTFIIKASKILFEDSIYAKLVSY